MDKKIGFFKMLDYILCTFLFLLSIKKGGFYKFDTILFNLVVNIIAVIYIIVSHLKNNEKKESYDLGILILFFSIAYLFPIIFSNYSSLNDSIFEMIRYFNIYLVYFIVRRSNNKVLYKNSIIIIGVVLAVLGVDQIANGYMNNILGYFNSGYLTSNNIDRMSSTIQYANVFALICEISFLLCLDNTFNKRWNCYINNIFQVILLSGIILSESRIVIFILIISTLYMLIKNKKIIEKNSIKDIVFNILYAFIYVVIINKFINNNSNIVYIITLLAYIINLICSLLLKKYICNIKLNISSKIKKICTITVIIAIFISFSLHTYITLDSNSNKSFIARNIYKFENKNTNNLKINIRELEEDTRYEIEVFQVDINKNFILENKLYYYSTTTGDFDIDINPIDNLKYINININCTKGSLKIENISLNEKMVCMNYLFLPSNLIYRIIDGLNNSNSLYYRIIYQKDALKIITNSVKNFIFGIGGEGFRNEYQYFKTSEYNSTEIHNIYIQILLESGIIGLLLFICVIINILKNYKMNTEKLSIICILFHGIFDLDFSYMIVLALFGILLGLLKLKDDKKYIIKTRILGYISKFFVVLIWGITSIILIFSNIATTVNLYNITDLDDVKSIENKIRDYEKIVSLDRFEPKYRVKLNEIYYIYLNKINEDKIYNIDKYKKILDNMKKNLDYMQKNESMNVSNVIDISNQYFNNLIYLSNFKFNSKINLDYMYDIYLNIIYNNMQRLYYINDENFKLKVKNICIQYIEGLNRIDNNTIYNYTIKLENLLGI